MKEPWNAGDVHSLVELELDDSAVCHGILLEVTPSSVSVDFPLSASSLLIGESHWLNFRSGRVLSTSIRILARIQFRGEDENHCRYRFEISPEDSIAITTLIEHRESLRVVPPDGLVVPVQVWAEGGREVTACLDGLSPSGVSLLFAEDPDPFVEQERVGMRLRLPDQAETIELVGFVRSRGLVDGQHRYGLEFELGRAGESARKQRLIDSYITTRLVEMLRGVGGAAARE